MRAVASAFLPDLGLSYQVAVMERLLKRRDFLKVQKGRRVHTGLFSIQALARADDDVSRCGFTVSKKVDVSAVKRNRIRRRLKEAMRLDGLAARSTGMDFVVLAKPDSLRSPFRLIRSELEKALVKAHRSPTDTQDRALASPIAPPQQ